MAKEQVLATSPLTLPCPYCNAHPGRDCETSGGGFAVVHVARVKAAAALDTKKRVQRGEDVSQAAARIVKEATKHK